MSDAITGSSIYNDLAVNQKYKKEPEKNDELGQKAFLKLMITQLENQDPLSPQENSEFIAQLAQFSSVESLDRLNNNFDSFTSSFIGNQALQASSLVGRTVTVPAETTRLHEGSYVNAVIDVPSSVGELSLNIFDASGALVEEVSLGTQSEGELNLRWDGSLLERNGKLMDWSSSHEGGLPAGVYRFEVTGNMEGKPTRLETSLSANVNSVTLGAEGQLMLNLAGVGSVKLSDVRQFNE